jgi:hypothetical protein
MVLSAFATTSVSSAAMSEPIAVSAITHPVRCDVITASFANLCHG